MELIIFFQDKRLFSLCFFFAFNMPQSMITSKNTDPKKMTRLRLDVTEIGTTTLHPHLLSHKLVTWAFKKEAIRVKHRLSFSLFCRQVKICILVISLSAVLFLGGLVKQKDCCTFTDE